MNLDDRTVVNIYETSFEPYDLEGPVQDDMSLLAVSYGAASRRGVYVIRMEPGAVTIPHTHECMEELGTTAPANRRDPFSGGRSRDRGRLRARRSASGGTPRRRT